MASAQTRQRRHPFRAVAAVAAALVALAGCADGGGAGSADDPFRIVYVAAQTGLFATPGQAVGRGIQAHVDEINANGGLGGRQVELVSLDDQSDPSRAVTLLQEQMNEELPDLVIPGSTSAEGLAMAPLLERNEVVGVGVAASSVLDDVQAYPYYFSVNALQQHILAGASIFLQEQGSIENVTVVSAEDPLGETVNAGFLAAMDQAGFTTQSVTFPADAVDLTATFQQAVATQPDWIFMDGSGGQVAYLLEGREKAGAEDIPTIMGGAGSAQVNLLDVAQSGQLANVHATLLPMQAYIEESERSAEFATMFERVTAQGPMETALFNYATGWDVVGTWAAGVEAVEGELTGAALKEALESGLDGSADPMFPIMSQMPTAESHFPQMEADVVRFATITDFRDGMYVIE